MASLKQIAFTVSIFWDQCNLVTDRQMDEWTEKKVIPDVAIFALYNNFDCNYTPECSVYRNIIMKLHKSDDTSVGAWLLWRNWNITHSDPLLGRIWLNLVFQKLYDMANPHTPGEIQACRYILSDLSLTRYIVPHFSPLKSTPFSVVCCFLWQSQLIARLFVLYNCIFTVDVHCDMWRLCAWKREWGYINHVYLSGQGAEVSDETSFNSMLS